MVVGELRTWGDNNCAGGANPADSLKLLRFDAGLSVAQAAGLSGCRLGSLDRYDLGERAPGPETTARAPKDPR